MQYQMIKLSESSSEVIQKSSPKLIIETMAKQDPEATSDLIYPVEQAIERENPLSPVALAML